MFAEVIVDIAHSDVDKIFDYACGEEIVPGMRVTVPFGRSVVTGFVMRVKENTEVPPDKLREVLRTDEDFPAFTAETLRLAETITARYRVPMALTLRLFLPAEMRTGKVAKRYRNICTLTKEPFTLAERAKAQHALVAYLKEVGEADSAHLRERFGAALKTLQEKGIILMQSGACFAILTAEKRGKKLSANSPPCNKAPLKG